MPITLELPRELEERLDEVVKAKGQEYLIARLEELLEDIEDYEDAVRILALVKSGEMETYSLEEVSKELGLED